MSWIYVAVTVSAAIGAAREIQSSRAQQAQLEANAKANEFNAAVLRQRAEATSAAFNQREERQRRENRLRAGQRAVASGESGVGWGGSNADVSEQEAVYAELDALNIRYEGELQSSGLRSQASLEDYYGLSNRANATRVRRGMWLNAAGAALSSGSSTYALGK